MENFSQKTIEALIASNEAISESVKANSETVKATNETVKELTKSVQELVTTERERVLKDEYQERVNAEQHEYNKINDKKWADNIETINRSKRFLDTLSGASAKVYGALLIGILALLGFKFS